MGSLHDVQTAAVYMGSAELEMSLHERIQMIEAVEQSQAHQMAALGNMVMDMLSIDQSDAVYQSFRSKTTMGLEVGSLVAGGYGAVKGVIGFSKLGRMPVKLSKTVSKGIFKGKSAYQGNLLKTHLRQLEEYGTSGYRRLSNGRVRYYGELDPARVKGEMSGRRMVREWDPATDLKRTWHETLDHNGSVRIVRPATNDMNKIHYVFDAEGNFIEVR